MTGIMCAFVGQKPAAAVQRTAKTVTAYGNAQVDTAQSKFGGASFLGDGSGDYLQIDTYSDLSLSGDFTIECWYRIPGTVPAILPFYNSDHLFYLTNDGGTAKYAIFQGGSNRLLTSGITVSANTWYHVAFVRNGSTITAYHNGTSAGSSTWTATISSTTPTIGSYSTFFLNGWIDEYRISNTARYTANFTAPTAAFVNDSNTLLLLHMNGTDATTIFTDDNGVRTSNGISAIANAQVDTAQSKFGGASALFDGDGDKLLIQGFNVIGTSFTIECWARFSSLTFNRCIIMQDDGNSNNQGFLWRALSNGNIEFIYFTSSSRSSFIAVTSTSTVVANTWYHLAVVWNGSTLTLYRDGVNIGSANVTSIFQSVANITVGGFGSSSADSMNGWIDEIRLSNIARYSSNFTAPTAAFVNDANTLLLIHANGTDASTVFTDDNS